MVGWKNRRMKRYKDGWKGRGIDKIEGWMEKKDKRVEGWMIKNG